MCHKTRNLDGVSAAAPRTREALHFRTALMYFTLYITWGSVVVKALRYESDDPRIESRWCHWGFFFP